MMRSLMGTGRRALRDFHHNAVSPDNASSRLVNLQGVRMGRPGRIYISLSSRAGVLEEVRGGGEGGGCRRRNGPRLTGWQLIC